MHLANQILNVVVLVSTVRTFPLQMILVNLVLMDRCFAHIFLFAEPRKQGNSFMSSV